MTNDQKVAALLIGGLIFRIIIAILLYPGFDEAYYFLYTLNLDLSYFDHPPLVALITGFGCWLIGEVSQFTIRLGTLILHTGSLFLLYLIGARLFSPSAGIFALAIASLVPIFQIGFGVLTLPDSPLIFFWTASLYCASREFFPNKQEKYRPKRYKPSYRLAILGLLVGLACLSKYHGFILGLGLIGFCLTRSRYRSALYSPWTLLGVGLFCLAISPILIWNNQHEWVSFRFQSRRGIPSGGYNFLDLFVTFLSGIGYLFPTLGLPLWWISLKTFFKNLFVKLSRSKFKGTGNGERGIVTGSDREILILWVSLPLILGFTWLGGYKQILPTWATPGFWGATLLLGQAATVWKSAHPRWVRRWLWGTGITLSSLLLFALLHVTTGTLQKPSQYALFGGFVPPEDDPSIQIFDIQQLRQRFATSPVLLSALQNSSFVFTNRYYLAGQIGMALAPLASTPITTFDRDLRGFAFWSKPDEWIGKDALYVTNNLFVQDQKFLDRYNLYFQSIEKIGTVPIKRGGATIDTFHIYQAKNLLKPYPRPYGNK
ncbi:glycosyltransferase family 39 protein [Chroococcidiopsis sp. FACHB-1243]|uniref:ArnT family glycosyltransferase n=1 Tax=Chroococcidiopsis sp. [FACHB-1243] TaxID=2692781 RepID=UPI00177F773B|nr:glycosyltransferase family 39 protein [Chroococcidiopsis sp. [FACHB-1243]]MBD2305086.1 glycosyltransferase family 39 protein [Chroococcidiopsis sp. [FACHB-1243]]